MKRRTKIILWIYVGGIAICELLLLLSAYDNSGFQRHHTLAELAIIGSVYLAIALLWPIVSAVVIFQYFGLLPHPIEF
ncbi:MAG: hypothetical protein WBG16_03985 [Bradyrhizobium sp.]|uniref:hypothetical protein n=1 Tax=Bradyrhizobium sp. TaxID=376 RepID=UPI003C72ED4E